jgi:hypothetical protein
MLDPSELWLYELCFPGAITGKAEVSGVACGALPAVAADAPMGSQSHRCREIQIVFTLNWGA